MSRPNPQPPAHTARVVASHGRHVWIEEPSGERRLCHMKGKKSEAVVGDWVQWSQAADEGRIERVQPRNNLFYRQDLVRTKSFAANIDVVLVLIAAEPEFSEMQLARALIAAHQQGITALIALNKQDVQPAFDRAWARLQPYRDMGYAVLPLMLNPRHPGHMGLHEGVNELQPLLHGKSSLVLGPSGAGKSTLINRLVPHASAATNEISQALQSGKHTTTHTQWYWVDKAKHTALIDSPGFQEFGLQHIAPKDLAHCMPDIAQHTGNCRFYNCTHLHEPGCGVRAAVQATSDGGHIAAQRYRLYEMLHAELSAARRVG